MQLNRKQIQKLFTEKGLTQEYVAQMANVSPPFVTHLLAGRRSSQRVLYLIRILLDMPDLTIEQHRRRRQVNTSYIPTTNIQKSNTISK